MRLFYLEVKRIMKSRRTIILLAAALFLAIIMAYLPISFESINRPGKWFCGRTERDGSNSI